MNSFFLEYRERLLLMQGGMLDFFNLICKNRDVILGVFNIVCEKKIELIGWSLVMCANIAYAQNKEMLYDFTDIPQSLLINPGADTNFNYHVGVPFLSHFNISAGLKGASLYDVFSDDSTGINNKIEKTLNDLTSNDHLSVNQQLEIFSFGWKPKNKNQIYFSGGIYQELDIIGYFPKDFAVLAYQGNQDYVNDVFRFSTIRGAAELTMIYHFGYTAKVKKNLVLGTRAKLYSSVFNVRTNNNKGFFTTLQTSESNNIYKHIISNADITIKTSGYTSLKEINDTVDEDDKVSESVNSLINKGLLGGNLGFGFDFGGTYSLDKQTRITGSVNDLGLVFYTKDVETYTIKGNYVFEGFDTPVQFSGEASQNFLDQLEEATSVEENNNSYVVMRPVKLNGSINYSFNRYKSNSCEYCLNKGEQLTYMDAFGAQIHIRFRPKKPQYSASIFYQKRFFPFLQTKLTYAIDDYSFYNIGFVMSTRINKINFYISANNLLDYDNIVKARSMSMQLGFNIIM